MATPSIYSVVPSSGHTGGGQLVTVNGADFKLPAPGPAGTRVHGPWPSASDRAAPPTPTVRVLFGGELATEVQVLHPGIVQCRTPAHDPSGVPYVEPTPNTAGQAAVGPSDVEVLNLGDDGEPAPGESATLAGSYSFLRPDLTVPCEVALVLGALVQDLQRQVLANVEFNPHTDYDPTSGDFLNVTMPAALPGLALMNLKVPPGQGRPRLQEEEVTVPAGEHGYAVRRLAVVRDLVLTVLGVSDNQTELLGLASALEVYFRRTGGVTLRSGLVFDPDARPTGAWVPDPSSGTVTFPAYRETDTAFTGRIGTSNVIAFTFTMRVVGVPISDMPGLPQDATAAGATFDAGRSVAQARQ